MGENTNQDDRSPLLPDRYPQQDFFVCDIFDAVPKADMASMEHPIFSVSTKPDMEERNYARAGVEISIRPSPRGLATVHDRDEGIAWEVRQATLRTNNTGTACKGITCGGR